MAGFGSSTNSYDPNSSMISDVYSPSNPDGTSGAIGGFDSSQYQAYVVAQQKADALAAQQQEQNQLKLQMEQAQLIQAQKMAGTYQPGYSSSGMLYKTGSTSSSSPSTSLATMSGATSLPSYVLPPAYIGGTGGYTTTGGSTSLDPWGQYRSAAGTTLAAGMDGSGDPTKYYTDKLQAMSSGTYSPTDPSYQWRFDQGQQALERSQASKGLLGSGNAAIELQNYGQNAASTEYGAEFSRLLQGLSGVSSNYDASQKRLMQMAGVGIDPSSGVNAIANLSNAGTNAANSVNNYNLGVGDLALKQQDINNKAALGGYTNNSNLNVWSTF